MQKEIIKKQEPYKNSEESLQNCQRKIRNSI